MCCDTITYHNVIVVRHGPCVTPMSIIQPMEELLAFYGPALNNKPMMRRERRERPPFPRGGRRR